MYFWKGSVLLILRGKKKKKCASLTTELYHVHHCQSKFTRQSSCQLQPPQSAPNISFTMILAKNQPESPWEDPSLIKIHQMLYQQPKLWIQSISSCDPKDIPASMQLASTPLMHTSPCHPLLLSKRWSFILATGVLFSSQLLAGRSTSWECFAGIPSGGLLVLSLVPVVKSYPGTVCWNLDLLYLLHTQHWLPVEQRGKHGPFNALSQHITPKWDPATTG